MKFKICIFLLIFIIFGCSLTAISATENSNYVFSDDINFNNLDNTNTINNFTQLQSEIDKSNEINLTNNVIRQAGEKNIEITNKTITINGFGYTIDANHNGTIFNVKNSSLILNNVKLVNGNSKNGGAINLYNSTATIDNCIFDNNKATNRGSDIYIELSKNILIKNTQFLNSVSYWSSVFVNKGALTLDNVTFNNMVSNYATAIGADSSNINVYNSKFKNLVSNITAGAIGVKDTNITVSDCEFINTTAYDDAGAIFIDIYYLISPNTLIIKNSNFINCSSEFGGAIVILNNLYGFHIIDNCTFVGNVAKFNGGAIFTSYTSLNITNSNFTNNKAKVTENTTNLVQYGNGGALYLDSSGVLINSSNFKFNEVTNQGGAIYAYDTDLSLNNVQSSSNSKQGRFGIYGTFLDGYTSFNSTIDDTVSVNNTFYVNVVTGTGASMILVNDSIVIKNLTKFDLRDYHWVTPVRDQGQMGACWAFGTCAAIESALLRKTNSSYDLSENNMQNTEIEYSIFGKKGYEEGGYSNLGVAYALSWLGVFSDKYDDYDQLGKLSPVITLNNSIHLQDVLFIQDSINGSNVEAIKEALLNYGAVAMGYYHDFDTSFFNKEFNAYYNPIHNFGNHLVTIVGWDDNFSKDNFNITPPGDGAFIVKNSWGTDWGDNGYFYLSYYNPIVKMVVFIVNNTINYNKNYQLDYNDVSGFVENYTYYSNVYYSVGNDSIAAVGTYFNQSGVDYEVSIYINDVLMHTQKGVSAYYGYSTIPLTKYIPVCENDKIEVRMKSNSVPISIESRAHLKDNTSFVSIDGKNWYSFTDKNNTVACLKVYTVESQVTISNLTKYYGNDSKFVADLGVRNATVIFNINGVNYTRISDSYGIASLNINLNAGVYTITTYALGNVYQNTVSILSTIESEDLVKYYHNGTQYKATFFDSDGKALANTNVQFNINGVFYTRTTDINGVATLNINLQPGNYTITAINPNGETKSNNIEVKSVLIGKDLTKTFTEDKYYEVQLVNGQGKPIANEKLTLNINGVRYNKITDINGIAKLAIRLNPGDYVITTTWSDTYTTNKIIVKI